ncbi:MAG TPA: hypothetical protein VHR45_18545 [Thermoanaerobaculia bacterium]|nr:hypothetical protein [Thermoanaerobaculia bacterium]
MAVLLRIMSFVTTMSVINAVITLGNLLSAPTYIFSDSAKVRVGVGLGYVLAFSFGPVAAAQLWRFRESGRLAGLVYWAGSGVTGLLSPLLVGASTINWVHLLFSAIVCIMLLLPAVREFCAPYPTA